MTSPLLTSFASTHSNDQFDTEWNLMASPLICGSLSIMDNMIFDNTQLYEALKKDHVYNTLKRYANVGLMKLQHRSKVQHTKPVGSINDIFMDWLTQPNTTVHRVGFDILDNEANKKLRKMIKGFNDTNKSNPKRLCAFFEFMDQFYPDYKTYVDRVNALFMTETGSHFGFSAYPKLIQYRLLSMLGLKNAEQIVAKANKSGKKLRQLLLKEAPNFENKIYTQRDLERIFEDEELDEFFNKVSFTKDPTLTSLRESLSSSNSLFKKDLDRYVLELYYAGIPSANNGAVIMETSKANPLRKRTEQINFVALADVMQNLSKSDLAFIATNKLGSFKAKEQNDYLANLRTLLFNTKKPIIDPQTTHKFNEFIKEKEPVLKLFFSGFLCVEAEMDFDDGSGMIDHIVEGSTVLAHSFFLDVFKINRSEQRVYGKLPGNFFELSKMMVERTHYNSFV